VCGPYTVEIGLSVVTVRPDCATGADPGDALVTRPLVRHERREVTDLLVEALLATLRASSGCESVVNLVILLIQTWPLADPLMRLKVDALDQAGQERQGELDSSSG